MLDVLSRPTIDHLYDVYHVNEMANFCNVVESLVYKDKQMLILGDFNSPNIN